MGTNLVRHRIVTEAQAQIEEEARVREEFRDEFDLLDKLSDDSVEEDSSDQVFLRRIGETEHLEHHGLLRRPE